MGGKLTVYTGPMRSGKSSALISIAEKFQISNRSHGRETKYIVIKHSLDDSRCSDEDQSYVRSRSGSKILCTSCANEYDILKIGENFDNILIDEVQFFNENIVSIIFTLLGKGKHIWASGLDLSYMGLPFKTTANLCAYADEVLKLNSVCSECGSLEGRYSYLKGAYYGNQGLQKVGDSEYESLCIECYNGKIEKESRNRPFVENI